MSKTLVLFDGSNFYNKVKKLSNNKLHLTNFKYKKFAEFVSGKKEIDVVYYVGEIKKFKGNKKSELLYSSQQSLFSNLRKQNVSIKLGYLLMSSGKFHEKGVDVQMAVDIVRGAIKGDYKEFYIISSDTDLLPAIETAKEHKRKVTYVGFEQNISFALLHNCSKYNIVKLSELKRFADK